MAGASGSKHAQSRSPSTRSRALSESGDVPPDCNHHTDPSSLPFLALCCRVRISPHTVRIDLTRRFWLRPSCPPPSLQYHSLSSFPNRPSLISPHANRSGLYWVASNEWKRVASPFSTYSHGQFADRDPTTFRMTVPPGRSRPSIDYERTSRLVFFALAKHPTALYPHTPTLPVTDVPTHPPRKRARQARPSVPERNHSAGIGSPSQSTRFPTSGTITAMDWTTTS